MLGIVAVLHADMASDAEIIVVTGSASDEVLFREFYGLH
jgi:hypothetical protein